MIKFLENGDLVELHSANLKNADLSGAKLNQADLSGADLTAARLIAADLSEANLSGAKLRNVDFQDADLSRVALEGALCLENTNLRRAKGLIKEQLEACKAKGAVVDENSTISSPLPPVEAPEPLQSNVALASPTSSVQENVSTPNEDEKNVVSPQQNSAS